MAVQPAPAKKPAPTPAPTPVANGATGKRGRMKKEDAPFVINYVNDKGEISARVPNIVSAIQVVSFDKKSKTYPLDSVPPATARQLAAESFKRRLGLSLSDVTKANISSLFTNTDEFFNAAKNGTVFAYKEGGGPGRSVDFDYWIAVVERVAEIQVKEGVKGARKMSDKDKADFRTMFEAKTNKEREEAKAKWRKNPVFRRAELQIKLEREEENEEGSNELLSIL